MRDIQKNYKPTVAVKIVRVAYHNFKGLPDNEIVLDGNDVVVYGENGTGKTSFADSVSWLLTGKMLNGKTAKIKHLSNGIEVNGENHWVEVELNNGAIFRKELTEKGVSDTSSYFINGISLTESKYKTSVNVLVPDEMFPILSNLFAAVDMKWQDLRALLIINPDTAITVDAIVFKQHPAQVLQQIND